MKKYLSGVIILMNKYLSGVVQEEFSSHPETALLFYLTALFHLVKILLCRLPHMSPIFLVLSTRKIGDMCGRR